MNYAFLITKIFVFGLQTTLAAVCLLKYNVFLSNERSHSLIIQDGLGQSTPAAWGAIPQCG